MSEPLNGKTVRDIYAHVGRAARESDRGYAIKTEDHPGLVLDSVASISYVLGALEESLESLAVKLEPVRRGTDKLGDRPGDPSELPQTFSPLRRDLLNIANRINNVRIAIDDLTSELEL